jgi:outer membrane receptor for ferrienterochelin and colicins
MITHASRVFLLAGASILALGTGVRSVRAQSVNYGALEALYGEPVTTSVTGKPQIASNAPADLTIITQNDIRRSGANNIPDILQFVAGIDVRRYGSVDADVAVRGYNQPDNPRLLVLVNGRQVYLDDYGLVLWQGLPVQLDEIRQIEIVKGPNSALFGFNAASGVINIITYDPLYDSVNTGTLRFGSQGLMQGSAVTTVHLGKAVGIRMSVGGLEQHEYAPAVATPTRNPALGNFNIDSKAQVAPGVQVTLEGSVTDTQNENMGAFATSSFDTYHTNSIKAGVIADTALGTVAIDAYRNWMSLYSYTPTFTDTLNDTVYVLQGSDTLKLNTNNTVRASLEYRNNSLNSSGLVGGTIGYAVYSAAGMWDWQITPALSFTNSVRMDYLALYYSGRLVPATGLTGADYNNATLAQPSFNSGLVYKLTDQDTIRLTAGRGLQVPSLVDYGFQLLVAPPVFGYVGNPTVQPTAVWNIELGYDHGIPAIGSMVTTAVYVQRNDNILTPPGLTPLRPQPGGGYDSLAQNSGYSDAVGGEFGIKGSSRSGFRWNASYALEVIHDHLTINRGTITSPQNYQDGTPTSVVVLGGGYTRGKLEMNIESRWQSRFTDYTSSGGVLTPVYVSDYITFLARIGYQLTPHLIVALTGQQFNVSRLVESAGPPVQRSVIGSVTANF